MALGLSKDELFRPGLWSGAEHGARSTGARVFQPGAEQKKNPSMEQWSGAEPEKNTMAGAVERRKFDRSAAPAYKTEITKKKIFAKTIYWKRLIPEAHNIQTHQLEISESQNVRKRQLSEGLCQILCI
jgi:hypothetical protein